MTTDHDSRYRQIFAHPQLVRDLLDGFVPYSWAKKLQVSTFERVNASYVGEHGEQRHGDMVWRLQLGGEWIYIYILLEFQSRSDRWMALRMQAYVGLLCQDLVKQRRLTLGGHLPPVLPIVLYNGKEPWTARSALSELMLAPPEGLAEFQPEQKYLLIDQSKYMFGTSAANNIVRALFRLECGVLDVDMCDFVETLGAWLHQDENQFLLADFTRWTRGLRQQRRNWPKKEMEVAEMNESLAKDYIELCIMIMEKREKKRRALSTGLHRGRLHGRRIGQKVGRQEGLEEGRQEGKVDAQRELIRHAILRRLGTLPAQLAVQIDGATATQLADWTDRLIDGARPEQVFNSQ